MYFRKRGFFILCNIFFLSTISLKLSYDLLVLLFFNFQSLTRRSNNNVTNEKWPVVVGNMRENPPGTYRAVSRAHGSGNLMIRGNKLRPAATLLPRVRKRRYSFQCFAPLKRGRVYTWRRRTRVH